MVRRKIEIKKIDNINARQVTFSKRRRGLFKKAQELSTLCDAEIALIVFSATSKLFEYASSSMQQVIERRNRHSAIQRLDLPSVEQQVEIDYLDTLRKEVEVKTHELSQLNGHELQGLTIQELHKLEEQLEGFLSTISKVKDEKIKQETNKLKTKPDSDTINYFMMREEVADKTRELRKLNGEELQGLKIRESQKLEKLLRKGLTRVSKAKDERIVKDITALKKNKVELVQDNRRLKQIQSSAHDLGQSSNSIMICSPSNRAKDSDNYDTSLHLGLPLFK